MSRIRSATIVIRLAPSSGSTAKSSSTEEYRDFEEINIDEQQQQQHSETNKVDFLDDLSSRALEAAGRSDKVVVNYYVTNNHPRENCQDCLVKRLIAGGASHENITVVRLTMDNHGTKADSTHRNESFYRTDYCTWRPKRVLA